MYSQYYNYFIQGNCYFAGKEEITVVEAKINCALRGGFIVPIKSSGTYEFLKIHAKNNMMGNFHIGKFYYIQFSKV